MEILNANHHLPHDALVLPVELATKEPSVPAATVTLGATVTNGAVTDTDATYSDTCNSRTTGDEGLTTDTEPDNATVPNKPATEHSGLTTDTEPEDFHQQQSKGWQPTADDQALLHQIRREFDKPDNGMCFRPKRFGTLPRMTRQQIELSRKADKEALEYIHKDGNLQEDYLQHEIYWNSEYLREAKTEFQQKKYQERVDNKLWTRKTIEPLGFFMHRTECCPRLIHSIYYTRGKGHEITFWAFGELWQTAVTQRFIEETLLMPEAAKGDYYKQERWIKIRHYDLRETFDTTNFKYVRAVKGSSKYVLIDNDGVQVTVSWHFASMKADRDTLKKARYEMLGENVFIKVGRSARPKIKKESTGDLMERLSRIYPPVAFRNKDNNCCESALCSGLVFKGLVEPARRIMDDYASKRTAIGSKIQQKRHVKEICREHLMASTVFSKSELVATTEYDPLNFKHRTDTLMLAELRAGGLNRHDRLADVNLNHCVCFVGNYVFDSNRGHALPITRGNLDIICGDIVDGARYWGLKWCYSLVLEPIKIKQEEDDEES